MDKSFLHMDRLWLDGDKVVTFVYSENPITSVFFNLRPGYEELAGEMIDYAKQNIPNFDNAREFTLFAGQKELIEEVEKRGYKVAWKDVDYIFDFTKGDLTYELPMRFHFADPFHADAVKLPGNFARQLFVINSRNSDTACYIVSAISLFWS